MRVRLRADYKSRITDGRLHRGVTALEIYYVLEVSDEHFRVIDDKGEPILYPKALFDVLDTSVPPNWRFCEYPDGEYHLEPVRLGRPGFYDDFFGSDGDRAAQAEARRVLREVLEAALLTASDQDRSLIERDMGRLTRS